jgi:NAD(P)H dehydrogenase (quinone)
MKVCIIYAHPSDDSFTRNVRDSFIRGLESAGHTYVLSDLYKMNFQTDMTEAEYQREACYRRELPVPADVAAEQEKINQSDALAFIYPVFWTEAPAKLVGWFDRVWTYGFAYGENRTMKQLEKGLVLCVAGNTGEYFAETGFLDSMKRVMLDDRLFDRVKSREFIVLPATSRELESRQANWDAHLARAFRAGAEMALPVVGAEALPGKVTGTPAEKATGIPADAATAKPTPGTHADAALPVAPSGVAAYRLMVETAKSFLDGESNLITALSNLSAVINLYIEDINWAGFYLRKGEDLVLGPFQGRPACTFIPQGRGVCGRAAQDGKAVVVPDVHVFPGHIACDSASNSEIVIPLFKGGQVYGVLDVDSPRLNRFSEVEADYLGRVGSLISEYLDSL